MTIKWQIGSYVFDFNPAKDSGWIWEEVRTEQHPIGAGFSVLQSSGFKSATRTIEGITKSITLRDGLIGTLTNRAKVNVKDHNGIGFTARVLSVEAPARTDISNPSGNYQAWDYKIVLMYVGPYTWPPD